MCNLNNITENYIQSNIYYIYICQPHIRQLKYPGFTSGPAVSNLLDIQETCRRCRFDPWIRKIPWSRKWQPTPVFLPGNPPNG